MSKYTVCDNCGAHLDHGETCDCRTAAEKTTVQTRRQEILKPVERAQTYLYMKGAFQYDSK